MSRILPQELTLVSHNLCPYVQRAVIALEEQGRAYKRVDIDLENPPGWFRRLSPLGKVPLLLVDDETVLFESAVIAEYINEIGDGELLDRDPVARARQRAWIEFASATLDNIGALYSAVAEKDFLKETSRIEDKWRHLEENLKAVPLSSGEKFSLVDAAFAPMFRYFDLIEQLVDLGFLDYYPRVVAWRQTLKQRESVIRAVSPGYQILLAEFIARRNSWLAKFAKAFVAERQAA